MGPTADKPETGKGNEMKLINMIEEAIDSWEGWDWAMDFAGCPQQPGDVIHLISHIWAESHLNTCPECPAAMMAMDYDHHVRADAQEAAEHAMDAAEAIERGDYAAAERSLESAVSIEMEYGDAPSYRHVLDAVREARELVAEEGINGWSVKDPAGGVWWPDEATQEAIAAAPDPEAEALRLCRGDADHGEWKM